MMLFCPLQHLDRKNNLTAQQDKKLLWRMMMITGLSYFSFKSFSCTKIVRFILLKY